MSKHDKWSYNKNYGRRDIQEKKDFRDRDKKDKDTGYKVLFDSSVDRGYHNRHKRSRSRSSSSRPKRSPSPSLLKAILAGQISETLEVIDRSAKPFLDELPKIEAPNIENPYEFTPQPILVLDINIQEEIESSRRLREKVKQLEDPLVDTRLRLQKAFLKNKQCDGELNAIQAQLFTFTH